MSDKEVHDEDVRESPGQIAAWVVGIIAATGGATLLIT